MEKYYIIFNDDNEIIIHPQPYAAGSAIATNYNFMAGTKEAIFQMFPSAEFPEPIANGQQMQA